MPLEMAVDHEFATSTPVYHRMGAADGKSLPLGVRATLGDGLLASAKSKPSL